MQINEISKKIFTVFKKDIISKQSNPFSINFKNNLIMADVFEPSFGRKNIFIELADKVSKKIKKTGATTADIIDKSTHINLDINENKYSVKNLLKQDVETLSVKMEELLSVMEK